MTKVPLVVDHESAFVSGRAMLKYCLRCAALNAPTMPPSDV